MRYKLILSFLMFIAAMTNGVEVKATTPEDGMQRNLLDLTNLVVSDDSMYLATTKEPVVLEAGVIHTLVLDYGFIGQHAGYVDYLMVSVNDDQGGLAEIAFVDDPEQQRIHMSFVPDSDFIVMGGIPVIPETSYDAMLYQGTYEEFLGFKAFGRDQRDFGTIEFDAANPPSFDDLRALVSASLFDGTILDLEVTYETYQQRQEPTGTFQLTFEAQHDGVKATYDLYVDLVDRIPPVIEIMTPIGPFDSCDVPIAVLVASLHVSDDVDVMSREDIDIIENELIGATEAGTYDVIFSATDKSGNTTILKVSVVVMDHDGPEISGPPDVFIYSGDDPLSDEDILSRYHVYDSSDDDTPDLLIVEDNYLTTREPGVYRMTLSAEDSNGNVTVKHINIHVVMDASLILTLNEGIIRTTSQNMLTESELIHIMKSRFEAKGILVENITITKNTYLESPDQAGEYQMTLHYVISGRALESDILILVSKEAGFDLWRIVIPVIILGSGVAYVFLRRKARANHSN